MKLLPAILSILLCQFISHIQATLFVFLIEDTSIFQDCKNEPDYLAVTKVVDMSNLNVEILDDRVHMEGSFTVNWEADPDDRVEFKTELFKYERGSWQPTIFTMVQKDFCKTLFDEGDAWYTAWMQFVEPENQKCINQKGVSEVNDFFLVLKC